MRKSAITVSITLALAGTQAHATGNLWNHLGVATQDEVQQLHDQQEQRINHLNGRVDISRAKEQKLHDRIDTTNRQVDHVDSRVDTAMGKAEKNHDRIDTTNGKVAKAHDRISKAKRESQQADSIHTAAIADFQRSDARQQASIQRNTSDIAELQGDVKSLRAGVAGAVAAASHQFDVSAGSGAQVSIAGGYYEGENAASLAIGGPLGERSFFNVNATLDSRGNDAYGVGATFKLQ